MLEEDSFFYCFDTNKIISPLAALFKKNNIENLFSILFTYIIFNNI